MLESDITRYKYLRWGGVGGSLGGSVFGRKSWELGFRMVYLKLVVEVFFGLGFSVRVDE